MRVIFPTKLFFRRFYCLTEKKKLRYSFIGRVDENEHGFQNGGCLTLASYLIKESISISMEFKETLHKRGDKFSVLIKMIENKLLGLVASTLKNAINRLRRKDDNSS